MANAMGGIKIEDLRKVYGQGDTAVEALKMSTCTLRQAKS
jgi:hypothetical protein